MSSLLLLGGCGYRTDGMRAWTEMFLYLSDSLRAIHHGGECPEPPPVLLAVVNAKDRRSALEMVCTKAILCFEEEPLVERGELVPRAMVRDVESGRMYDVGEVVPDLSE